MYHNILKAIQFKLYIDFETQVKNYLTVTANARSFLGVQKINNKLHHIYMMW